MAYYGVTFTSKNSLSHFGIKGQKWGVRRFQNADGSYTQEGKERYGRGNRDGATGGWFIKKRDPFPTAKRNQIKKDFDSAMRDHADQINKQNRELIAKQDLLTVKFGDYLSKQKLSASDKENIWNDIRESTQDYEPYEEKDFFYEDVNAALESQAAKMVHNAPQSLKKDAEELDASIEQFRKNIQDIVKPVLDKYDDQYVKDIDSSDGGYLPASYAVEDFLIKEYRSPFLYPTVRLPSDTPVDYLVLNTKAFSYNLNEFVDRISDEFSMDEYYKRYGYK